MLANNEVMVTVDGSALDDGVLSAAIATADLIDGGVRLVRIAPSDGPPTRQAARLMTSEDGSGAWKVFEGVSASRLLIEAAQYFDVQTIVMGTRAQTEMGRALVGSVADEVLLESRMPVVLVPPAAMDFPGRHVRFRRVLVPLDGSAFAARALNFLLALPQAHTLELVIVEVVRRAHDVPAAERRLRAVADGVALASASVAQRVVVADDTAKALVHAVREYFVDLIAMTTRGAGGAPRLMLGHVAQDVMRAAETPILLLTPAMLSGPSLGTISDIRHAG